ncbi:uncharacterized protein [Montipora capricornis]|uniref:uncharacterized protein isoform X2 n=1 Tax=Montipora foliosa TaxID=591990 RepID=UPI0035F175E9
MMLHASLKLLLFISVGAVLCATLPLTYKQNEETASLFDKLFPSSGKRSMQDDWKSVHEHLELQPLEERSNHIHEQRIREELLWDLLKLEKRRLEETKVDQATAEKRESQQRCYAGQWGICGSSDDTSEEMKRKREELALRKPEQVQLDDAEMQKMKQFDMELERALSRLETKEPGSFHHQM